jgi:ATP-dependent Clp protease ATP-binding subunit ClpA
MLFIYKKYTNISNPSIKSFKFSKKTKVKNYLVKKFINLKYINNFSLLNSSTLKSSFFQLGINFNNLMTKNNILPFFGRDIKLLELIEILSKRQKNNVILSGKSGVGKTTFIKILAHHIINKLVPFSLEKKVIISINLLQVFINPYFKKNFLKILEKISQNSNIILFFDDFQNYVFSQEVNDFILALKSYINNKEIQCIITLFQKDQNSFLKDTIFFNNFDIIYLKELKPKTVLQTLYFIRPELESYYNVSIKPGVLKLAVLLSEKYLTNKVFPKKTIDLLDSICSKEIVNKHYNQKLLPFTYFLQSSIKQIKLLRLDAFRKNNIEIDLLLSQIEQFYNLLLNTLINIKSFSIKNNSIHTLSNSLINKIQLSFLSELNTLFSSNTNYLFNIKNKLFFNYFSKISIYLYFHWLTKTKKINSIFYFALKIHKFIIYFILKYNYFKINTKEIKSETLVFSNILTNLKPLIQHFILQSYKIKTLNPILTFNIKKSLTILNNFLKYSNKFIFNLDSSKINLLKKQEEITENKFIKFFSKKFNIKFPLETDTIKENLIYLEDILHQRVIGQNYAISSIAASIRRSKLGIKLSLRPISSFLFCGPTGVGKTEVTKMIARLLFNSEDNLVRFDMSEFMEKFNISRLIGSPPGYIGYENGGQLTEIIKKKPSCVVLFDEIEKAHIDILNILLQILDDGRLTDSKKQTVLFNKTIIIMTSNLGAKIIQKCLKNKITFPSLISNFKNNLNIQKENFLLNNFLRTINLTIKNKFIKNISSIHLNNYFKTIETNKLKNNLFSNDLDSVFKKMKKQIIKELYKYFLPEFLNRLDDIILFFPLTITELRKICDLMILDLQKKMLDKNIKLLISDLARDKIVLEGFTPTLGARPLRRLISKYFEDLISQTILGAPKNLKVYCIKITVANNNYISQLILN